MSCKRAVSTTTSPCVKTKGGRRLAKTKTTPKGSVVQRRSRDYIETRCNHGAAPEARGARPAFGASGQLDQVATVAEPQDGERYVESADGLNFERHGRPKTASEGRSRCGD